LSPLTLQVSPMYELVCDFMQASTDSGEIESEVPCLRPIGDRFVLGVIKLLKKVRECLKQNVTDN
jgi:hypothetical protein